MEKVQEFARLANSKLKTADHLTYVTFPTVQENKLMVSIVENIFDSMVLGMDAVLAYDRIFKRIPPHTSDYLTRLEIFKNKCAPRYNFTRESIVQIEDLRRLVEAHKKSPMEFSRKDKYIIFGDNYQTKTISIETIKNYLSQAKSFIDKVNRVLINAGRY